MYRFLLAVTTIALAAACGHGQQPVTLKIWPGDPPGETGKIGEEKTIKRRGRRGEITLITNVTTPTIKVFLPPKEKNTGAAVIVCPGGGYSVLAWDYEGEEVAQWLNSLGVAGIVLKYRVPRRPDSPRGTAPVQPLMDAQRAIRLVRANSKKWGIDPNRVGILGFSAGGHLSAHAACRGERAAYEATDAVDKQSCRPNFAVLIYPAYLTTKKDRTQLAKEIHVTKQTPPMFFAHAADDPYPPDNSIQLFFALRRNGVAGEVHVYAKGGHGFGIRPSEQACSSWPQSCARWMKDMGFLAR